MKKIILIINIFLGTNCMAQNMPKIADSIRIKYHIPAMAYAVITADKILQQQVIGYHQVGQTAKKDTALIIDYFHLGSNTKAITGFIGAYLVEQNKISWDTKFFDLFPEWRVESDSAYINITLKDLLSHRAHIQPYTSGAEYQKLPKFIGTKSEQRKSFAHYLLKQKPIYSKAEYNYSNAGYSIGALMLEKVSGLTWEQLVENVMNKKLDLHTKFGWPNLADENQPWGHWVVNNKLEALPPNTTYNLNLGEPSGDISITLPNYIKFMQLNMAGLIGKSNLLKSTTYNFLHYGIDDYAIGWGNANKKGKRLSDHSGSAGTFFCYTFFDNEKNIAYFIVANSGGKEAEQGVFALLNKLLVK